MKEHAFVVTKRSKQNKKQISHKVSTRLLSPAWQTDNNALHNSGSDAIRTDDTLYDVILEKTEHSVARRRVVIGRICRLALTH